MSRLDEIAARLEAATPGPWEAHGTTVAAMTGPGDCGGCSGLPSPAHEPACYWSEIAGASEADAALIAHAPADLAALLGIVREVAALADDLAASPAVGSDSAEQWEFDTRRDVAVELRRALEALTETTEGETDEG